jgi:hypothetical protein
MPPTRPALRLALFPLVAVATLALWGIVQPVQGQTALSVSAWGESGTGHLFDGFSVGLAHRAPASAFASGVSFGMAASTAAVPVKTHRRARYGSYPVACWDPWDPWYGYWPACGAFWWTHAWAPYYAIPVLTAPVYYGYPQARFSFSISFGSPYGWGWADPWWGLPGVYHYGHRHRFVRHVRVVRPHYFVYAPTYVIHRPVTRVAYSPGHVYRRQAYSPLRAVQFKEAAGPAPSRTAVRRASAPAPAPSPDVRMRPTRGEVGEAVRATPGSRAGGAAPERAAPTRERAVPTANRPGVATRDGVASRSDPGSVDRPTPVPARVAPGRDGTSRSPATVAPGRERPSSTLDRRDANRDAVPSRANPTGRDRATPPAGRAAPSRDRRPSDRVTPSASRAPANPTPATRGQAAPATRTQPGPTTRTRPSPSTRAQPGPTTGTQPGPTTRTAPQAPRGGGQVVPRTRAQPAPSTRSQGPPQTRSVPSAPRTRNQPAPSTRSTPRAPQTRSRPAPQAGSRTQPSTRSTPSTPQTRSRPAPRAAPRTQPSARSTPSAPQTRSRPAPATRSQPSGAGSRGSAPPRTSRPRGGSTGG